MRHGLDTQLNSLECQEREGKMERERERQRERDRERESEGYIG